MISRSQLWSTASYALAAGLSVAVAAGCQRDSPAAPAPPARPNVVLVSIDTLRADHLGCYGYPRDTSPQIDALAAQGVRFTRAYSTSSWTLPAHMSIMTSLYPHVHGVDQAKQRPSEGASATLAERLREGGFQTVGFASWVFTSSRYGFDRGFDRYADEAPARQDLGQAPRADRIVDAAIEFLESDARSPERPFFLFVHLFDPHLHYEPPPAYRALWADGAPGALDGRYESIRPYIRGLQEQGAHARPSARDLAHLVALYDGEIRFADAQVGRLLGALQALGLDEHTVVVVTSDHGEELDDHGSLEGHQWTLYQEVVRVPLVVRAPGALSGAVSETLVSLVDVAPTILDLAGLPVPESFQGRSLAPVIRGEGAGPSAPRFVFSETRRFTAKWSVLSQDHKLIVSATGSSPTLHRFELYDLANDPAEKDDVFDPAHSRVRPMLRALRRWMQGGDTEPTEPAELSARERERLRALGYLQEEPLPEEPHQEEPLPEEPLPETGREGAGD